MADVLSEDRASLDEIVRETETQGLWVAPATLELASTEVELFTAIGREMVLRDALTAGPTASSTSSSSTARRHWAC